MVTLAAPPILSASGAVSNYVGGSSAVYVDNKLSVSSADVHLTGAVVTISAGTLQSGDSLNFTNQNGITGSYLGGVLSLSGSATVAAYQTALRLHHVLID